MQNLEKNDLLNVRNELRLLELMENEKKKSFNVFETAFAPVTYFPIFETFLAQWMIF